MKCHTIEKITQDLIQLGVKPGAPLMIHASLRAIGRVENDVEGVIDALEGAVGLDGGLLMVFGAQNEQAWVNEQPQSERGVLLKEADPFDALTTPVDPEVGYLAEAFRVRPGTKVSDNPEGRFGARGKLASALLENAPWDDYYGPGSPLEKLCHMSGSVLRLGADSDTTNLLHYAEYLVDIPNKKRVTRHRLVTSPDGPIVRTVTCLDDEDGIVDFEGEDYFSQILKAYLQTGRAAEGKVGNAQSQLMDAQDLVDFAVAWMGEHLGT